MSELDRVLERVRQSRIARERRLTADRPSATGTGARNGLTHAPGTRVFDTISGLEGEVIDGARENVIVSTTQR